MPRLRAEAKTLSCAKCLHMSCPRRVATFFCMPRPLPSANYFVMNFDISAARCKLTAVFSFVVAYVLIAKQTKNAAEK